MYKLILFLLISLSSCTIVQNQSIPQVKDNQQVLLIDHIVNMYVEDLQLVKQQQDFTYLTGFYYTLVFERLKFNDIEKSYFMYVVEEKSEELNYTFEYD